MRKENLYLWAGIAAGFVCTAASLLWPKPASYIFWPSLVILITCLVGIYKGKPKMTDRDSNPRGNLWGGLKIEGGHSNKIRVGKIEAVHPVQIVNSYNNDFQADELIATTPTSEQISALTTREEDPTED